MYKGLGQVAYYKPVTRCGMEELAMRQQTIEPSSGVLFARNADGEEKTAARERVLDLFHPQQWTRRLNMLTMPGVHWRFERKLLGMREIGWMRYHHPRRTFFAGVENDRSIFFAAAGQMPGLHTPDATVKRIKRHEFAEHAIKTKYSALFFANIDDLMMRDWQDGWDAAWLDYTGPLTTERLAVIARFYQRYVHHILIVTALKARWNNATTEAIAKAGGYMAWLRCHLHGDVLHQLEYHDTSPMAQLAVRKIRWHSPLI